MLWLVVKHDSALPSHLRMPVAVAYGFAEKSTAATKPPMAAVVAYRLPALGEQPPKVVDAAYDLSALGEQRAETTRPPTRSAAVVRGLPAVRYRNGLSAHEEQQRTQTTKPPVDCTTLPYAMAM